MHIDSSISGSFRQLVGNGNTFAIPPFQRDYSWETEQWSTLWDDILLLLDDPDTTEHYMGYLVCQTQDSKHFTVIDGQQRLTTISIIILAAIACIEKSAHTTNNENEQPANQERAKELRRRFIGELDTETLSTTPKLTLNRHDDDFYKDYLVPLQTPPTHNVPVSAHRLHRAFKSFSRLLEEYSKGDGKRIAKIINTITDGLYFTIIRVDNEVNAFKVFETLNARAMQLSSADLLKNYLFSYVATEKPSKLEQMERFWERIVSSLGRETVSTFLRVYWNSYNTVVRKSQLFKKIRDSVKTSGDAIVLLRNMANEVEVYVALRHPITNGSWKPPERDALNILKQFHIKQSLPLLLTCYRHYYQHNARDFTIILKALVSLSFRYNVICGLNPNDQESVYSTIANRVANNTISSPSDIIVQLKQLNPSNEIFQTAFIEKEFDINNSQSRKILRYILFAIEKHLSGTSHDKENDSTTIEHVCPQSPTDTAWQEETIQSAHRIGNTTLLEDKLNKKAADLSYDKKRAIYQSSKFAMTLDIPQRYHEWNVEKIHSRQQHMAKLAASIWKL